MVSVNGYYNGSNYVAVDEIDVKPNQRVIITVLDDFVEDGFSREHELDDAIRESLDDIAAGKIFEGGLDEHLRKLDV